MFRFLVRLAVEMALAIAVAVVSGFLAWWGMTTAFEGLLESFRTL